jgi:lipoprotein-releasing system ATP-binding protein
MNKHGSEVLTLRGVGKRYFLNEEPLTIFEGVQLGVAWGEFLAVVGPSGCGKSTLLNIMAGLEVSDEGEVLLEGLVLTQMSEMDRDLMRRDKIGMVFQSHQLLPEFSALENCMLPRLLQGASIEDAQSQATLLLEELGLGHRFHHRSAQLSGGEQQRVAIARALVNQPSLVLADEPTGSLDPESGQRVFDLFRSLQRERGLAVVLVTHNPRLAEQCDRIWHFPTRSGVH